VLVDRLAPDTVAGELQGELRRVEQQVRWSGEKASALAELPEQAGRRVSRLLVLRDTHAMREIARAAEETLHAAYPSLTQEAVAALRGDTPWPGPAIVWMRVEGGRAPAWRPAEGRCRRPVSRLGPAMPRRWDPVKPERRTG
jgi:hypothetical protein